MVPEFFPFERSRICSTARGKAFILKAFVCFVLEVKDFKSKVEWKTKT